MAYVIMFLITFAITFDAGNTYAQAGFRMSPMDRNTDRRGSDYKAFDLQKPDPALCQDACLRDPRCMAWTYERPRCWLKQAIPKKSKKPNCVSGYKIL